MGLERPSFLTLTPMTPIPPGPETGDSGRDPGKLQAPEAFSGSPGRRVPCYKEGLMACPCGYERQEASPREPEQVSQPQKEPEGSVVLHEIRGSLLPRGGTTSFQGLGEEGSSFPR